jgi:anti-sigma B factor antagonist
VSHAQHDDGGLVVDAPRELDLAASEAFRNHVAMCFTVGATDVVIDLRDTTFVDSAGIGALIGLTRRAQALGVGLRLRAVGPNVRTALRMSGADRVLDLEA